MFSNSALPCHILRARTLFTGKLYHLENLRPVPQQFGGQVTLNCWRTSSGHFADWSRSRDGVVVRTLASHQCGPGSIPAPGVICGLSLCWSLTLLWGFFSRYSSFFSLRKKWHTAYLSWLLAVLQGHARTVPQLPAARIYGFSPTLLSCVLAVFVKANSESYYCYYYYYYYYYSYYHQLTACLQITYR